MDDYLTLAELENVWMTQDSYLGCYHAPQITKGYTYTDPVEAPTVTKHNTYSQKQAITWRKTVQPQLNKATFPTPTSKADPSIAATRQGSVGTISRYRTINASNGQTFHCSLSYHYDLTIDTLSILASTCTITELRH